ncbi:hypothetical protein N0V82_009395 [Gnomoniopsis sp. IMI 355080]|nr:hypothetical protein N0V82_009395 [Gnomoniopsis sp. IMI 355080]
MQLPPSPNREVANLSITFASTRPPAGLSALHIAVIQNDRQKVRALLANNEHGVDERTSTGATALMLASLYGRCDMFFYLLRKSASISKQDFEGFGCLDYVKHRDFTNPLLEKYEVVANEKPARPGRKIIYNFLRPFSSAIKQGRLKKTKARTPLAEASPAKASPGEYSERRVIFLRKGGMLEVVEVRSLAVAEWPFELGRKTCATIRGSEDTAYRAIAISGWRGDEVIKGAEVLNNATYLEFTRGFGRMFGYRFKRNWLDYRWKDPAEKDGAFHACHAEKQLAIFILRESIAHVLGIRDITIETLEKLKLAVEAEGLQWEFTIELEHKPCDCCLRGKRSKLEPKRSSPTSQDDDTIEDVIDVTDEEKEEENDVSQLVDEPDMTLPDTAIAGDGIDYDTDDSWVVIRHPGPKNRRPQREHRVPTKAGSEVREEDLVKQNIGRRLRLTSSQKKKQKRRQKTAALNQLSPSPNTEGHVRSFNFEIPIRAVRTPDGKEPFPKVGEFMSLWGASSKEKTKQ